ncbi:autotransporter outer membrane beta-barrel domain-containing protein, partial [Lysobacteraceae bacterium NML91-0268]
MNLQQLRKKSRSRLFQAISFSLLTAALPMAALAQAPQNSLALLDVSHCSLGTDAERQHCRNQQLSSKLAALHGEQVSGNASASNTVVAGNYTEAAKLGDADSWKTEEFMQDWGLEAMNAHHAYARGLTGNGIRVGIFDSGVGLDHPEFAGRDHQGLKIGELLADGSRCAPDYYLGGAYNPCFGTDGGRAQLDITYWDPDWARLLPPESMHLVDKTELLWVSHGTHVAGTVAANRDGSGMHGVAFGADFSSARLFADTAMWAHPVCVFFRFCEVLTIEPTASAFEDMYQQMNAADIRAMNHSWGLGREPENTEEMQEVFDNPNLAPLWPIIHAGSKSKGMIQVWAAGNSRYNLTPEESPIAGIYASLPRFFNDLEPYWLSVVNVRKGEENESAYVLSEYSMRCGFSKDWCIAAPGTDINSTVLGGQSLEGAVVQGPDGNFHLQGIESLQNATTYEYEDYTGTSMAAPHVTGALALLFERYPYLTNAQVRDVLLTTATDLGAPGVDDVYGWGMVNLKKAIEGYGQFRVDTDVNMVAKAGGTHGWNDARVWDVWTNDISGAAFSFSSVVDGKDIGGWLRLAGNNSFAGLTVNSGTLELTGDNTLGSDVVVNGGVLRNNGTLRNKVILNGGLYAGAGALHGDFHLAKGGSIAPGNSIGTLTIN